jgi:glycine dehydrogenase
MTDQPYVLADLETGAAHAFSRRHIGVTQDDVATMLQTLGYESLEALMQTAVPASIAMAESLNLPGPASEDAVAKELRALAAANRPGESMIGLGYYGTITPPVIRATYWRTRPGTPPTRPTSRRSPKAGSRRC